MGDSNPFFLWLWRFNALVLALLGLLFGAFAIANFIPRFPTHTDPVDNFLAAPQASTPNVSYDLSGSGIALQGTTYVLFNLQRSAEPPPETALRITSGGRSRDFHTVNLLVVDGADASSHWLFKGLDRIITADSVDQVETVTESDAPKSPVVALVIEAFAARSDKAGTLKAFGPDALYYYRLGTDEAVKFFSAPNIRSIIRIGTDKIFVLYEDGHAMSAATFSTRDFKLVARSPVPPVAK
jgi:hypothetical protein